MCYLLIYLIKGSLPWTSLIKECDELKDVLSSKHYCTIKELCFGLPKEVLLIMKYIKYLEEDEEINYKKISRLLSSNLKLNNFDLEPEDEKCFIKFGFSEGNAISPCNKTTQKIITVSFNDKSKQKIKQNSNIKCNKENSKDRQISNIQIDVDDSFNSRLLLINQKLEVNSKEAKISKKKTINDARKWTSVCNKNNKLSSNFMQIINSKTPKKSGAYGREMSPPTMFPTSGLQGLSKSKNSKIYKLSDLKLFKSEKVKFNPANEHDTDYLMLENVKAQRVKSIPINGSVLLSNHKSKAE